LNEKSSTIESQIVQMDPLSDIVALLRPHAVLSKLITGRGTWGVRYMAYDEPGFFIVLSGRCWHDLKERSAQAGLLAGMRDPAIAVTLRAMHSNVNHGWTVAGLARQASMSRSAYAKRFGDIIGCGPMEYLSRWRMSLAQDALTRGSAPLETRAREVGDRSAAAFSNAFRRRMGCPPGSFGRSRRESISN
jgi:AraC-like DNA-binding protein